MDNISQLIPVNILTHHRSAELQRTLEHLLALPRRPAIVVVDNASFDFTSTLVKTHFQTVTLISLAVNAALNFALVRPSLAWLGDGGGGVGAAAISVGTEALVALTYVVLLCRDVLDRASVSTIVKSLGVCACVVALHVVARPLGPVRLALDALAYAVLAIVTGAVRVRELYAVVVSAWRGRRNHATT